MLLMAFYLALANGHMGAAAAVSGLLCAAIPAAVSAWQEGAPGAVKLSGFLLAAAAIWLVATASTSSEKTAEDRAAERKSMVLSILGGLGFGVYFTALKLSSSAGVVWPTAAARVGSWGISALIFLALSIRGVRQDDTAAPTQPNFWWILGGSLLDLSGNGSTGWLGKLVSGLVDQEGHPFKSLDIGTTTAQALRSITTQVPTLSNTKLYAVKPDPIDRDGGK